MQLPPIGSNRMLLGVIPNLNMTPSVNADCDEAHLAAVFAAGRDARRSQAGRLLSVGANVPRSG
jgi:hypothetical protein